MTVADFLKNVCDDCGYDDVDSTMLDSYHDYMFGMYTYYVANLYVGNCVFIGSLKDDYVVGSSITLQVWYVRT